MRLHSHICQNPSLRPFLHLLYYIYFQHFKLLLDICSVMNNSEVEVSKVEMK